MATPLGARFVQALAARNHAQVASLLHPEVDFRGMTPGRFWEASTATQVAGEILRSWYEDRDQIDQEVFPETFLPAWVDEVLASTTPRCTSARTGRLLGRSG
jgi:hypothetical protein